MKSGKIIVDLLVQEDRKKASIMSNEVEFLNQNRRATEKNVLQEAVIEANALIKIKKENI